MPISCHSNNCEDRGMENNSVPCGTALHKEDPAGLVALKLDRISALQVHGGREDAKHPLHKHRSKIEGLC